MSAEHIVWAVCVAFLAIAYACSAYVLFVSWREKRTWEKATQDFPHPHGHLPSDFDYSDLNRKRLP